MRSQYLICILKAPGAVQRIGDNDQDGCRSQQEGAQVLSRTNGAQLQGGRAHSGQACVNARGPKGPPTRKVSRSSGRFRIGGKHRRHLEAERPMVPEADRCVTPTQALQ